MKRLLISIVALLGVMSVQAADIKRIEPAFWWVGMQNPELQIMVYGDNIASTAVSINYEGITLKEVQKTENPNYLFLYLNIAPETKAGKFNITFTEGRKKTDVTYELRPRATTTGAQGFSPSDVLYLVMPDRFANGNPKNDVYDDEPIDRNKQFSRHGGDFAGIVKHSDYFNELGVTTIWFNPVLENAMKGGSYHGYATTDFYKIDPRFGSNEDYVDLIATFHSKGLKVVMDMIYNHCGSYHWWMSDLPSTDWINPQKMTTHNLYTLFDPYAPESELRATVDGWFVSAMPDLNQRNPHLATYLIQNSIWWIEYSRIDGIRHDTHPYADYDFLARWCKAVSAEYPDFNIVGESWYMNSAPLAWWQANSKINENGNTNLKTTMDFNLLRAAEKAFTYTDENPLLEIYQVLAQDFLYVDKRNILIFLDNHDTSRFVKKEETDLNRYKQGIALLLTMRGIPQIYYGTEILMSGEKKDGDGQLRNDFPGGWEGDPIDAFTRAGRTDKQNEAWDFTSKLLHFRASSKAITDGGLLHYQPMYDDKCYLYVRMTDTERVIVILNGSDKEQKIPFSERYAQAIGNGTIGTDVVTEKSYSLAEGVTIAPKGVLVLDIK